MTPGEGLSETERCVRPEQIEILSVAIDRVDFPATLALIDLWVMQHRAAAANGRPRLPVRQICTVNPEFVMDARRNPDFAAALQRADLRVPDGVGILWAARLLGSPLKERVTGSDGIYYIAQRAAERGWRVYFLGAAPGVAEQTAEQLRALYPGLQVAGTFAGSPAEDLWPEIASRLAEAEPDILFVAYGHPNQDLWIDRHRAALPAAVALGIGGAFDFVSGVAVRAPRWMRRLGIEWLHRFVRQPWRWRRMLKLPMFAALILQQWAHLRWLNRTCR